MKPIKRLAVLALLLAALPLAAQVTPTTVTTVADIPAAVPASTTTNITSAAIPVPQGRGIALLPEFATANSAGAGNVTFTFVVSANGSDWSTFTYTWALASNGTNVVRGYTNMPASFLDNIQAIRVTAVQNASTNALTGLAVKTSRGD